MYSWKAIVIAAYFALIVSVQLASAQAVGERYSLQRVIETALQNNFRIKTAREEIERSTGAVIEARAAFIPALGLNANYHQIDKSSVPSYAGEQFGSDREWAISLMATQNLFAGGRDAARFAQQRSLREGALHDLAAVINDVLFEVRTRYYAALLARDELKVQEESVRLLEEELALEQNKLGAGTVSHFNVLRAEVALANSKTPYIRARNNVNLTLEELRKVIGLEAVADASVQATALSIDGVLDFIRLEVSLDQALERTHKGRPELQALKFLISAAEHGISIARSDYFPSLNLYAGYDKRKSPFSEDMSDDLHGWRAGAEASWKIFDGFATSGRVTQANADARKAKISLEQQRINIDVEVRRAHSSLLEARALVEASQKVEEQAEESLRLASERFAVGSSPQIDVLDSQVALTDARTNKVRALFDYNVARAALERAMGENVTTLSENSSKGALVNEQR